MVYIEYIIYSVCVSVRACARACVHTRARRVFLVRVYLLGEIPWCVQAAKALASLRILTCGRCLYTTVRKLCNYGSMLMRFQYLSHMLSHCFNLRYE